MSFINALLGFLNTQTRKNKIVMLVCIVLAVFGSYWYFVWSPQNQQMQDLLSNLRRQESRLTKLRVVKTNLSKFSEENKRLEKTFRQLAVKLPEEDEMPDLIDNVYSAVSLSGLQPKKFHPQGQRDKGIYAEIPIKMNVRGSYWELVDFFKIVSELPRIVNIRDFTLKTVSSEFRDVTLDADLSVVTFKLVEK